MIREAISAGLDLAMDIADRVGSPEGLMRRSERKRRIAARIRRKADDLAHGSRWKRRRARRLTQKARKREASADDLARSARELMAYEAQRLEGRGR